MKTSVVKYIVSFTAGMLFALGAKADRTWTGESTESTKYWSDAANWSGSDGTWFVNTATAPTIYFSEPSSIANILRIDCGTTNSPVVFTTGDTDDRTKGLSMDEGSGNARIGMGADAVLKVDGGAYTFANDLVAGSANGKTGTLIINKGKVATRYWTVLCGYADGSVGNITVNGGELAVGTGNGRLVIGQYNGSTAVFTQTGGTVTSQQGEAALEMACGTANATYNLSGGLYTAKGKAWIGCGTGTANVNISGTGKMTTTDALLVGHANGARGTVTVGNGGTLETTYVVLGAATGGTGSLIVDGGTFSPSGTVYINENNKATDNIGILEVRSGSANLHSLQAGRGSGSTGTISVSGGTLTADEDIVLGDGGNAALNISGSGTVVCQGTVQNAIAKWIKLGNSGSGDNAINLNEGGTLRAWHIERLTTEGTATVNFNGGTLEALGVDDGWNKYLIGNTDTAHTENPTVTIGEKGGTIDVGANNITITSPVSGTGTIAKSGSGTLKFTDSYFGGISVNDGAGSVTTPGSDTVSAGAAVFLASRASGTVPAATLDDKTLWIEENGHVTLSGVTLDFSSATEQKLFDVTSFKLLGTTVSAETDVSGYFSIADAAVPYKVIYKSDGLYAVYNPTENVWIGGNEGVWSKASNWSEGVIPSETSLVAFTNDTVITCSGTGTAKHWLKLRLDNNATLEFQNTDDSTYPGWLLGSESIEGNGTIVLTHCGFYATADVTIPDTISLVIKNSGTIENGNDCWLTTADGCTLTVAGSVAVTNFLLTNGSVVFGGAVTVDSGARVQIASGSATFNGALACNGTAILEKASAASVTKGEDSTFTQPTVGSSHVDAAIASLYSVDTSVNYWVGGESGYWNVDKNWNYGVPAESGTARFDSAATIYLDGNKTVASIVVNASVMFSSTDLKTVHPTVYIHDVDGTGTIRLNHVGLSGNGGDKRIGASSENTLTLEFVSAEIDSWLENVSVYAPITGSGYIRMCGGTMLYGNNRAFTGTVTKDNADARFMTAASGFPKATSVTINGTLWLWFTEGEIEFGGNFTAWSAHDNRGINLPSGVTNVTLTVGGNNGAVILSRGWTKDHGWHPYYSAFVDSNGWQQGTDKFKLRKIGSGAITEFGLDSTYNFSLEGGSINLGADKVYTGAATILTVTNATLGIAAATTLATADFKSGSTLQSTYYDGGVNLLTVTGAATLDGVTLTAAGTTPSTDSAYTVLSANSLSGTATSGIADPDTTDKKVWKALVGPTALRLRYYKQPLMFIVK